MSIQVPPVALLRGPIPVHLMADQEFCELKVDIELRTPAIDERLRENPALEARFEAIDQAKAFHRAVARPAEAASAEVIEAVIASAGPFTIVETALHGEYAGLRIMGIPDALHCDGKGNAWIVEYKVRDSDYLSPSDDAQLRLYGFLFRQDTRFSVASLYLVCVHVGPDSAALIRQLSEAERAAFVTQLCGQATTQHSERPRRTWHDHSFGRSISARAVTFVYDHAKSLSELEFLTSYWLGSRHPKPTLKPNKCAACRVNAVGPASTSAASQVGSLVRAQYQMPAGDRKSVV